MVSYPTFASSPSRTRNASVLTLPRFDESRSTNRSGNSAMGLPCSLRIFRQKTTPSTLKSPVVEEEDEEPESAPVPEVVEAEEQRNSSQSTPSCNPGLDTPGGAHLLQLLCQVRMHQCPHRICQCHQCLLHVPCSYWRCGERCSTSSGLSRCPISNGN